MFERISFTPADWTDAYVWHHVLHGLPSNRPLAVMLLAELTPLIVLLLLSCLFRRGSKGWGLSFIGSSLVAGMLAVVIVFLGMSWGLAAGWALPIDMLEGLVIAPSCAMALTWAAKYCACRIHDELEYARWHRRQMAMCADPSPHRPPPPHHSTPRRSRSRAA